MNDNVKRDNRKAFGKFILTIIIAGAIGAAAGYFGAMLLPNLGGAVFIISVYLVAFAPWILWGWGGVTVFGAALMYALAAREAKRIDPEQDNATEKTEKLLSWSLFITSVGVVGMLFFFGAALSDSYIEREPFITALLGLAVLMAAYIALQKLCVDMTRRLNPEKRGSVFERDFNKKWIESCDEAERMTIYKSAYSAFRAVTCASVAVWIVALLLGTLTEVDTLGAMAAAMLIWCVQIVAYMSRAMKN